MLTVQEQRRAQEENNSARLAVCLTDAGLIRRGWIDQLAARFGDKEFVVRRSLQSGRYEWVASIDTCDGSTEWTADPRQARFFRGDEWVRVWARPGHDLLAADSLPL